MFLAKVYVPVAAFFFLTAFVDPFKFSAYVAALMLAYCLFVNKGGGRSWMVNRILIKSFIVGRWTGLGIAGLLLVIFK